MKLAYFPGCKISFYLKEYDLSFRAVMGKLDVDLVELPFNCCGYPVRDENFEISIFSSIKNLAMAEAEGLDLITPCKCCFGQFKHAVYWYNSDPGLKARIDSLLLEENLDWSGTTKVKHLLNFLHQDIGFDRLKDQIRFRLRPGKIAVQYGCHALRPFSITGFDNPFSPQLFEDLLGLTGVELIEWSKRTECCGNPILDAHSQLSLKILQNKYTTAKREGADHICTACTHCQMQYELAKTQNGIDDHGLTPILFTQILGAAFGIPPNELFESGNLPSDLF